MYNEILTMLCIADLHSYDREEIEALQIKIVKYGG